MGTPKKIVADSQCFLCSDSPQTKERVKIFGKSSVDIVGLLKSIGIEASTYVNSSNLFICTKICYKRLLKLQRLQNDLNSAKKIVIESFSKTRTKRLLSNTSEIDSRDGCCSKSNESTVSQPSKAVKSLCFASVSTASSNCSRTPAYNAYGNENVSKSSGTPFIPVPDPSFFALTSTPNRASIPKLSSRIDHTSAVKLSVHYESKTVNKILPKEYELLGKALAHGPAQRIAKAIFKCVDLKKLVVEKVLRLVCSDLCSTKTPSLLRKTGKKDMVNFSFESVCEEWKTKAPIFYAFLMTVANSKDATWLPSVAVAGAALLKQRNTRMNAIAAILGIMLKTRSIEVLHFHVVVSSFDIVYVDQSSIYKTFVLYITQLKYFIVG